MARDIDFYIEFLEKGIQAYTRTVDTKTLDDLYKLAGIINMIRLHKIGCDKRKDDKVFLDQNKVLNELLACYREYLDRIKNA